jgi:UPF0042 nucleotide-binding protein
MEELLNAGKLVIITGMSGAGKTVAVQCLEDLGYFCVDNLPPVLIPKFAELIAQSQGRILRVALVIDLRGREFFTALADSLRQVQENYTLTVEIIYLEASDDKLVQRYKESRRKHPMAQTGLPLDGIVAERRLLQDLRGMASQVIDTTSLKPGQLKDRIYHHFNHSDENKMVLNIISFGFKYGVPIDADMIMDVRFLPNPHYIDALRPRTGQDQEVYDYVMKWQETQNFLQKLLDLMHFLVPQYKKEGKSQFVIGIGCTGGKHRSVAISEFLGKTLSNSESETVRVTHRDSHRDGMK